MAQTGITEAKSYSAAYSRMASPTRSAPALSVLLITKRQGKSVCASFSIIPRSVGPGCAFASTTNTAASTSRIADWIDFTIKPPNFVLGVWKPGVSKKTICVPFSSLVCIPVIRFLVVCGFLETIAIFSPKMAFSRVLFPTFGRPTIATKPVLLVCIIFSVPFLLLTVHRLLHLHPIEAFS